MGVDVTTVPGTGAAGGLGGGLLVLGARLLPGFGLVADLVGLPARLGSADLVVTGEGYLDPPSFEGKVPGGVLALARSRPGPAGPVPVLCVVGGADRSVLAHPPEGMEVRSLVALHGRARARHETVDLIGRTTAEFLATFCP
jgi:glycerate kinase